MKILIIKDGNQYEAKGLDISEGGVRFQAEDSFDIELEDRMQIGFLLDETIVIKSNIVVKHINNAGIGTQFEELHQVSNKAIRALLITLKDLEYS